jgi:serine phosphatase RsbU (regulator of sigma subunit)
MELAAEMQWEMLLPSLCFASTRLEVDAVVEPAYDIGGDGFEYRINADVLDMVFLDAMGHSLDATLVTALALGAYRHARRRHLELPDIARSVDRALMDHFDAERFLTGHLCQLDLETGRLRWVNAGHPPPYLVRHDEPVRELTCEPALPLGLGLRIEEVGDEQLEPGDRLVFYSDGVVEARTELGEYFGEERLQGLVDDWMRGPEPPGVVVRRIVDEVMAHQHGDLRDDATLMVLEWRGPAA